MSFRRYVGKFVQVLARGADGTPVTYLAKLYEYEAGGIWLHHDLKVSLPGGTSRQCCGYLFIPHEQIINVFGCDELDRAVEELQVTEGGGL